MFEKKTQRGFGLAGMSMVAALVMSGALFAQEAEGVPEVVIDDGAEIVIDDSLIFVDPICLECTGDEGDGSGGPVEYVDDDGVVSFVYEVDPLPECADDGCVWDEVPVELSEDDPVIYYMTGGAPEAGGPEVVRDLTSGSAASRGVALQRGPDLCAAPAQEVVWLCTLLNGKPKSE